MAALGNASITISENAVEIDGNIVTSRSAGTAMELALSLIELLEGKEKREALQTADVIREVHALLTRRGPMKQGDIVDNLSGIHGERVIKRVLKRQAGKAWDVDLGEHNAKIHTAIAGADLPAPRIKLWGSK